MIHVDIKFKKEYNKVWPMQDVDTMRFGLVANWRKQYRSNAAPAFNTPQSAIPRNPRGPVNPESAAGKEWNPFR